MTEVEETAADLWATGLSPGRHPTEFVRAELTARGVVTAAALRTLPDRSVVEVAGVVTHRQQPETAKGTVFLNLEDETGLVNVICTPGVWKRYRKVARIAPALRVRGRARAPPGRDQRAGPPHRGAARSASPTRSAPATSAELTSRDLLVGWCAVAAGCGGSVVLGLGDELLSSEPSGAAEVVAGLAVVVVVAEAGEVGEVGGSAECVGDVVVDLEVAGGVAAGDDADAVAGFDRGAQVCGDGAAEVGDAGDVGAGGDDGSEDRVGGEAAGDGDGDGSGAVDLADLTGDGVTADVGGVADVHDDGREGGGATFAGRRGGCRVARSGRGLAEAEEGIEGGGVGVLGPTVGAVDVEEVAFVGFDRGHDLGGAVEGPADLDPPGPVGTLVVGQCAVGVGVFVAFALGGGGQCGGGDAVTFGLQATDAGGGGGLEQGRLGVRVGGRGRGDRVGLGRGELTVAKGLGGRGEIRQPPRGTAHGSRGAVGGPGDGGEPRFDGAVRSVADPRASLIQPAEGEGLACGGQPFQLDELFDRASGIGSGQDVGVEGGDEGAGVVEHALQCGDHATPPGGLRAAVYGLRISSVDIELGGDAEWCGEVRSPYRNTRLLSTNPPNKSGTISSPAPSARSGQTRRVGSAGHDPYEQMALRLAATGSRAALAGSGIVAASADVDQMARDLEPLWGCDQLRVTSVRVNGERVDARVESADDRAWLAVVRTDTPSSTTVRGVTLYERPAPFRGRDSGLVVVVNGPSSVGKSSLMAAFADAASTPWSGLDEPFIGRLAGKFLAWPETAGPVTAGVLAALMAAARVGNQFIASAGGIAQDRFRQALAGVPTVYVGLHAPLAVLLARQVTQAEKFGGLAEESVGIHDGWTYDLRIDTAALLPNEAARVLAEFLDARDA